MSSIAISDEYLQCLIALASRFDSSLADSKIMASNYEVFVELAKGYLGGVFLHSTCVIVKYCSKHALQ